MDRETFITLLLMGDPDAIEARIEAREARLHQLEKDRLTDHDWLAQLESTMRDKTHKSWIKKR